MIYSIARDGYKYQELDLEVDDFIEYLPEEIDYLTAHEFSKNNLSLASSWQPLTTGFSKIEGEENIIPDICTWIDATLLLSQKAKRLLGDALAQFGELLPIDIEGEDYTIFNCLTVSNLDNKYLIFKSPSDNCTTLYCQTRLKNMIEEYDLKGLAFEKVNG